LCFQSFHLEVSPFELCLNLPSFAATANGWTSAWTSLSKPSGVTCIGAACNNNNSATWGDGSAFSFGAVGFPVQLTDSAYTCSYLSVNAANATTSVMHSYSCTSTKNALCQLNCYQS
jgi:hypothetical protein